MQQRLKGLISALSVSCGLLAAPASHAATIGFADIVLAYFDSGAGRMAGPYGGLGGISGSFPVAVPVAVVLGSDVVGSETFLSLPTGSFVTVGFLDETVIDGVGNDIFIQEIGAGNERADVFVSTDNVNFVFLGTANDSSTTSFDLASIGFAAPVSAIRIVGLDNGGGSPGFDVVNVQVLPGSIGPGRLPEPGSLLLVGLALVGLGLTRRR